MQRANMNKRPRIDSNDPPQSPPNDNDKPIDERAIGLRGGVGSTTEFQDLPLSLITIMFTSTPAIPIDPQELIDRLRASGFTEAARVLSRNLGNKDFWRNIVGECFPNISQLPVHIEEKLRSGKRYYNVPSDANLPASEPRTAIDQAWRDAFHHVINVLQSMETRALRGRPDWGDGDDDDENDNIFFVADSSGFVPPLRLEAATQETCGSYVRREHTDRLQFDVDTENQAVFAFKLNVSTSGPDDDVGMSDDEIDVSLRYDDLPTIGHMARGTTPETIGTVPQLLGRDESPAGAFVYRGQLTVPAPFDRFVVGEYDVRWNTQIPHAVSRFQRMLPPRLNFRANIDAHLTVRPWLIDDTVLFAVEVRQRRPRTEIVRRMSIPLRMTLSWAGGVPERSPVETSTVPWMYRVDRLYDDIRAVAARNNTRTPPVAYWRVSIADEWNADGSVAHMIVITHDTFRKAKDTYLNELLGPPRPHRPMSARTPGADWYDKRAEYVDVKVVFRV